MFSFLTYQNQNQWFVYYFSILSNKYHFILIQSTRCKDSDDDDDDVKESKFDFSQSYSYGQRQEKETIQNHYRSINSINQEN